MDRLAEKESLSTYQGGTDLIAYLRKLITRIETLYRNTTMRVNHVIGHPGTNDLHSHRIARATYDFSKRGGTIGTISLGVELPNNAIVTRAFYEVLTTFTSATDAATMSIDIPADDVAGIIAATAISAGSNVWDFGNHEAIQTGTASNFSEKTTAPRELSVTIAVEVITAGKFILWCEYIVSD